MPKRITLIFLFSYLEKVQHRLVKVNPTVYFGLNSGIRIEMIYDFNRCE